MRWEPAIPAGLRSGFVEATLQQTIEAFLAAAAGVLEDLPHFNKSEESLLPDPGAGDGGTPEVEYTRKVVKQVVLDCRDVIHQVHRFDRFRDATKTTTSGDEKGGSDVAGPLRRFKAKLEAQLSPRSN